MRYWKKTVEEKALAACEKDLMSARERGLERRRRERIALELLGGCCCGEKRITKLRMYLPCREIFPVRTTSSEEVFIRELASLGVVLLCGDCLGG